MLLDDLGKREPPDFLAREQLVPILTNGGFEAGLTGWTVVNQAGGSGNWFSQSGTGSPLNHFAVPAPPEGIAAAMTDQGGPGSHVLYQDFVVPTGVTSANLSFMQLVASQAAFSNPGSLDYLVNPNQHARVDIMTSVSQPFSTAVADVLLNLQIHVANTAGYENAAFDLTALLQAHEGETLRLRFAEVDNQLFFNNGIDNVNLDVTAPEPASMLLFGLGALGIARRSFRQRV